VALQNENQFAIREEGNRWGRRRNAWKQFSHTRYRFQIGAGEYGSGFVRPNGMTQGQADPRSRFSSGAIRASGYCCGFVNNCMGY
jgi:hypothetical protein